MKQIEINGSLWILDGQERLTTNGKSKTKGKSKKQVMDEYVKDCLIGVYGEMLKIDIRK